MNGASDFYLDAISEVRLPTVSNGRVTLVGDAAYGGTLGGMGTGAAIVEAYVLAGELAAAAGDHSTAYARYEERTRAYALRCQRGARGVGRFMAPRSRMGIWLRNRMLNTMNMLPGKGLMERIAMSRAEGINVPEYSALHA